LAYLYWVGLIILGALLSSLVSCETGLTTTFGLKNAEERGTLFCEAGTPVYAGMVVGKHQRPGDLEMNVCKK
jgi:GTP-binding protein